MKSKSVDKRGKEPIVNIDSVSAMAQCNNDLLEERKQDENSEDELGAYK